MSSSPLGVPKGTRDFGPQIMARRQFIFDCIRQIFLKYGFQPLETPAMENLSVLTGKYGDEGDQLLYKVLNSGDFLKKTSVEDYRSGHKQMLDKIAEKGLRYDLTVPFARYVSMNRHEVVFPFKRYQIQPVWRADRPQKGRYREFYQCDADVVGTESLLCETEIIAMVNEVFSGLGITDFTIQINHRQLLAGLAESIGARGQETLLAVSLDKLGKIGKENVMAELKQKGFTDAQLKKLQPAFSWQGKWSDLEQPLNASLGHTPSGTKGIRELQQIFGNVEQLGLDDTHLQLNVTLARGLAYYTGAIFEVGVNNVDIGSVGGGGRYDDLTGIFGLPDVSGVGISFGVDRIFDVMEHLDLFPARSLSVTRVLLITLDDESEQYALGVLQKLRTQGIPSELYPDRVKLKKALGYANKKEIPFTVLIGSNERASGRLTLKHMAEGTQTEKSEKELISFLLASK